MLRKQVGQRLQGTIGSKLGPRSEKLPHGSEGAWGDLQERAFLLLRLGGTAAVRWVRGRNCSRQAVSRRRAEVPAQGQR